MYLQWHSQPSPYDLGSKQTDDTDTWVSVNLRSIDIQLRQWNLFLSTAPVALRDAAWPGAGGTCTGHRCEGITYII